MARKGASRSGKPQAKKLKLKRYIDCSIPVEDGIFDLTHFEKFVLEKFKVEGKTGNLKRGGVQIQKDGDKLVFISKTKFKKKYLKYLTKKYLRRQEYDEILRIVASDNDSASTEKGYQLKYYQFKNKDEDEEGEEAAEEEEKQE